MFRTPIDAVIMNTRKTINPGIIVFLLCFTPLATGAQNMAPKVEVTASRDTIFIGDQFTLSVKVDKDVAQVVEFPSFEQNLIGGKIEIVEEKPADTLARDGRSVALNKEYTVTCFDAGAYPLDDFPVLYLDKNVVDTILSGKGPVLVVTTFEIDTATMTIRDIKDVMPMPRTWAEVWPWVLLVAAALAVAAAVMWAALKLFRKGNPIFAPKPPQPPHVIALQELEKLRREKLWEAGKYKEYYSRLTDILRTYLEGRFGMAAMEMTSGEILSALSGIDAMETQGIELVLPEADLVKFAKYVPSEADSIAAMGRIADFVEHTRPEEKPAVAETKPEQA